MKAWLCLAIIWLVLIGTGACSETFGEQKSGMEEVSSPYVVITVGEHILHAVPEHNDSAKEWLELLEEGNLTVEMEDYGGFEKVGDLGAELTRNDEPITAEPGDVILYQGNQITIYYGTNSWNFTRLARIEDTEGLKDKLGEGKVTVTVSLEDNGI